MLVDGFENGFHLHLHKASVASPRTAEGIEKGPCLPTGAVSSSTPYEAAVRGEPAHALRPRRLSAPSTMAPTPLVLWLLTMLKGAIIEPMVFSLDILPETLLSALWA